MQTLATRSDIRRFENLIERRTLRLTASFAALLLAAVVVLAAII